MPTAYDIATSLKLSSSTVSRVLNGRHSTLVSDTTRERILRAAEEMGYRPNAMARALVTGRTGTIGLFIQALSERTDPHFAQMLQAVEQKAHALGYRLVVSGDLKSIVGEGRVDGVVILGQPDRSHDGVLASTPVVFVHSGPTGALNNVCWSDAEGAYQAIRYLLELGHRGIAGLFAESPDGTPPPGKVAGFRRAIAEACAKGPEWRGVHSGDPFENAYLLTRRALTSQPDVTAIFGRNDVLALGALKAAREAGRSVPGDLSLIGYNDTLLAHCADPGLTSVRTPIAQAGEVAVEQLVRAIEEKDLASPEMVLPTALTERSSCAPPFGRRSQDDRP